MQSEILQAEILLEFPVTTATLRQMTYASQQLADALQELAREPKDRAVYGTTKIPSTIDANDRGLVFPAPVAEFLNEMERYSESAKSVSVGVY